MQALVAVGSPSLRGVTGTAGSHGAGLTEWSVATWLSSAAVARRSCARALVVGGNFRRGKEPPIGLERSRRRIECRLPLRGGAVEIRTGCVRHRPQGHPDPGPPHQHLAALQ